eukprot:m.105480 g.105480  ORF g.105480 m.105480 type:complete len:81 (+) comp14195_c0_seq21:1565-1807(+)
MALVPQYMQASCSDRREMSPPSQAGQHTAHKTALDTHNTRGTKTLCTHAHTGLPLALASAANGSYSSRETHARGVVPEGW